MIPESINGLPLVSSTGAHSRLSFVGLPFLLRPRGWSGERGGYLGAITTEKLPRLPKAPPLVSGETTLANAMPSTNGAKNDQG